MKRLIEFFQPNELCSPWSGPRLRLQKKTLKRLPSCCGRSATSCAPPNGGGYRHNCTGNRFNNSPVSLRLATALLLPQRALQFSKEVVTKSKWFARWWFGRAGLWLGTWVTPFGKAASCGCAAPVVPNWREKGNVRPLHKKTCLSFAYFHLHSFFWKGLFSITIFCTL